MRRQTTAYVEHLVRSAGAMGKKKSRVPWCERKSSSMSVNKIYEKRTKYEYSASVYHCHLLIIIKSMIKDLGSDTSSV